MNREPLEKLCAGELSKARIDRAASELPTASVTTAGAGLAANPTAATTASSVASAARTPDAIPVGPSPLDASRKLAPLTTLQELVERLAYVLEHDTDIDEFERVAGALVEAAPIPFDAAHLFLPVIKRATHVTKPMSRALAALLGAILTGKPISVETPSHQQDERPPASVLLVARMRDLAAVAAQGKGVTPLSAATHQRGFIDPALFVERVAEHQRRKIESPPSEQMTALLRLFPQATSETRARMRELQDTPLTRALRFALGDDDVAFDEQDDLLSAAKLIRNPTADDGYSWRVITRPYTFEGRSLTHAYIEITRVTAPVGLSAAAIAMLRIPPAEAADAQPWFRRWRFGGADEGVIRYSSSLLPSDPAPFFAEAAFIIATNIDWWEAQWANKAYLDPLLDPTIDLTPMATLTLALGLAGKEPGQTALCIDALASAALARDSTGNPRLNGIALGTAIRDLLAAELAKAARYAKSLRAALRINPSLATPLVELLGAALEARPDDPPKDTAMLLELLQEILVANRMALPERVRQALGILRIGGKGRAVRKALLG